MPKVPTHALIWNRSRDCYELRPADPLLSYIVPGEEEAWLAWLATHASFSFQGQAGHLNVLKESRPRGSGYWYAYHSSQGRTHKRYLGRTETLRLSRLEETARTLMHGSGAAQALEQGMVLLSSKLSPPQLPTALVERERLLAALDSALSTKLSLLCAPAGFGKTTLLAAWTHQRKTPVAWLSLDQLDNGPTRFWVALIAALRRCVQDAPDFGETVVALLQSPQSPPLTSCLSVLLGELESRKVSPAASLVLVLDDYQVIEDATIHESLSFFLEHLPAYMHLILASRVEPDLPLSRLRVRGQLCEIRADELRFQEDEASRYLGQVLSPVLSHEEVRRLVSRTEGWVAGLHLAALTLQKRADRAAYLEALTGSQRYLLDYVQEEILARLPEPVRDFLLQISILSQMDSSVCQAVTGIPTRAASQQRLEFLERANLFVVPLDEERHSYRLHEIFREALLSVLHTHHPELVSLLHRRAADFYAAQGQQHEAITHAFEARDYSTAARLMEQTVEQFWLRGEAETVMRWVLALPEPVAYEHARLLLTTAFYFLAAVIDTSEERRIRGHQQARQLMARVEAALQPHADTTGHLISITGAGAGAISSSEALGVSASEDTLLPRRLRILHLFLLLSEVEASGEYERVKSLQQEIQEELDQDEEVMWQIIPLIGRLVLKDEFWQEGAPLLPQLLEARQRASREASHYAMYKVRQLLAIVAVEEGRLRLAYEECQTGLDLIKQLAGYALLKGYYEVVLARVCYQWNRLEEAAALLRTALHDAAPWQHLDILWWAYIGLMQVELARGDQSSVQQVLSEMEQLAQHERFGPYPDQLPTLRTQWWLAKGQLEAASDWAAGVVFPEEPWKRNLSSAFPVVIRVYFAQHRWREVLALLERFRSHLDRPTNSRFTMTYLAQSLVALHHAGKRDQGRRVAARLFALTEPEGHLRVYLDEGKPMREALEALLTPHSKPHEWTPSTVAYISKLLAAFEHEMQGANRSLEGATTPDPASSPAPQPPAVSWPLEISLTRREQEVLRLLAAGASNQDIAQTLVISLDTVKKHVSNLLGKLGATSRTQAVAIARARSLL